MRVRLLPTGPHARIDRLLLQKRIYEWSKALPPWQRDLLRRVASGSLDDAGRREVMRILAGTADAPEPIPLELKDLLADEGEHGQVELRAIRDLTNINCQAPGQGAQAGVRSERRVRRQRLRQERLRSAYPPRDALG